MILNAPGMRYLWLCTTAVAHPELGHYPQCGRWDTAVTREQAAADAAGHAIGHDLDAAEQRRREAQRPADTRIKPGLPDALAAVRDLQQHGPVRLDAIADRIRPTAAADGVGPADQVDLAYLAVTLRRLTAQGDLRGRIAASWRQRTSWPCASSHAHELLWATPELDEQWLRNCVLRLAR